MNYFINYVTASILSFASDYLLAWVFKTQPDLIRRLLGRFLITIGGAQAVATVVGALLIFCGCPRPIMSADLRIVGAWHPQKYAN